ncbi:histidine phosphatase family protein [Nitratireductor sp. XY-223]|uniref:histidine phosphatase family protein n=1 Tax=Nitratireductor sp. XY-223 TaxID=2561926 RepID=UPI00145BC6E8|nr:histidine phosphatase family protein [Nitratireductor sp. XY-223]
MPDLYFLRHGQTDWNLQGRFQGASDIPLNETGLAQAQAVSLKLARYAAEKGQDPQQFALLSSPLLRARQTAATVARQLHIGEAGLEFVPVLREVSYGVWEGMTSLEVKERYPEERRTRKTDRWRFCPEGGESHASRIPELEAFLADQKAPAVVVSHTGVIRVCLYLLGCLDRDSALAEPISQDKIYVFSKGSLALV